MSFFCRLIYSIALYIKIFTLLFLRDDKWYLYLIGFEWAYRRKIERETVAVKILVIPTNTVVVTHVMPLHFSRLSALYFRYTALINEVMHKMRQSVFLLSDGDFSAQGDLHQPAYLFGRFAFPEKEHQLG